MLPQKNEINHKINLALENNQFILETAARVMVEGNQEKRAIIEINTRRILAANFGRIEALEEDLETKSSI